MILNLSPLAHSHTLWPLEGMLESDGRPWEAWPTCPLSLYPFSLMRTDEYHELTLKRSVAWPFKRNRERENMCAYGVWWVWISDGGKRQIELPLCLAFLLCVILNKKAHVYIYSKHRYHF